MCTFQTDFFPSFSNQSDFVVKLSIKNLPTFLSELFFGLISLNKETKRFKL